MIDEHLLRIIEYKVYKLFIKNNLEPPKRIIGVMTNINDKPLDIFLSRVHVLFLERTKKKIEDETTKELEQTLVKYNYLNYANRWKYELRKSRDQSR